MTRSEPGRTIHWVGSSLDDLRSFPEEVQDVIGYALYLAQCDEKHSSLKALRGSLHGMMQVSDPYQGNAYRVVYTNKFRGSIYVLHAFQKKATRGTATPRPEVKLILRRMRLAQEHHRSKGKQNGHGRV